MKVRLKCIELTRTEEQKEYGSSQEYNARIICHLPN